MAFSARPVFLGRRRMKKKTNVAGGGCCEGGKEARTKERLESVCKRCFTFNFDDPSRAHRLLPSSSTETDLLLSH